MPSISIHVPQFVHHVLERIGMNVIYICSNVESSLEYMGITFYEIRNTISSSYKDLLTTNVFISCCVILLIFWPLLLSMSMAVLYAWAWIFWITTSMIIGTLQAIYASYQFLMISLDVLGLSMMKTYSVLRHTVIYYLDIATTTTSLVQSKMSIGHNNNNDNGSNTQRLTFGRKSRRRIWREKLDQAGSYENFLKIRIEPKDTDKITKAIQEQQRSITKDDASMDGALPALMNNITSNNNSSNKTPSSNMKRASSFSAHPSSFLFDQESTTIYEHDESITSPTSPDNNRLDGLNGSIDHNNIISTPNEATGGRFKRNLSFSSGDKSPPRHLQPKVDPIVVHELGGKIADLLVTTTVRLKEARLAAMHGSTSGTYNNKANDEASSLKYLLSAVVKRNHLTLEDILIENARSVAESGQYGLSNRSRHVIRAYYEEVQKSLDWITDAPLPEDNNNGDLGNSNHDSSHCPIMDDDEHSNSNLNNLQHHPTIVTNDSNHFRRQSELADRITLIRRMKQNMGRTALMLSGGGAQAMYHSGVIRALIESKLYDDINVISGTSGGSIMVAMCAMKTPEELYNDICVPTVSTDYMRNGSMKALNIRWFPTMIDMVRYWMEHRLVVDSAEFGRTCEYYYSDTTFEEGFQRTGKHVCITVSASRANGNTAQRLLLNHISTPNVTIASAVQASCALPGVMAPAKLMVKTSNGKLEPFEVDGIEWIDGSVQADLPFQRIATLFGVTSFIVSQTNFHIVPFINKTHHPNKKSIYWRFFQILEWDIRNRALKLSRLGLFPRIFGQDVSQVFKQKYHGNLTIVPRFTMMQTFGLKILSNPTVKDMEGYLKYSQIAVWPYLNVIRDMIRLEKSLDDCLSRLEASMRALTPEMDWSHYNDDVESMASGSAVASSAYNNYHPGIYSSGHIRSVRIIGHSHTGAGLDHPERLRQRIHGLEHENQDLRRQIELLQQRLTGDEKQPRSRKEKPDEEASKGSTNAIENDIKIHQIFRSLAETEERTPRDEDYQKEISTRTSE